ncbi:VOC family protein [Pedobacter sp. MC2016-24]|uniref:VOC family protein n=1 Tax=Pedobacter sp. MC2016-24 TaxID=2780090 RepID=UPI00187EB0A0|nr:VOC family protein [Pedobacter sp. MC2016-24]MBE9601285.1 VOC family protein [Pedobacter sp. MC2016-24]
MATINPYLNFKGNTEEAFNFYKAAFGGAFSVLQRFSDTPHGSNMPEELREKIMHVSLPIGANVLMGTDVVGEMEETCVVGNNVSISISTESEAETDQLFQALSAGGKIVMPLEKAFWGAYFGMFIDKFGINWMVNYDYNNK